MDFGSLWSSVRTPRPCGVRSFVVSVAQPRGSHPTTGASRTVAPSLKRTRVPFAARTRHPALSVLSLEPELT